MLGFEPDKVKIIHFLIIQTKRKYEQSDQVILYSDQKEIFSNSKTTQLHFIDFSSILLKCQAT